MREIKWTLVEEWGCKVWKCENYTVSFRDGMFVVCDGHGGSFGCERLAEAWFRVMELIRGYK
jgi:hypothetical protein